MTRRYDPITFLDWRSKPVATLLRMPIRGYGYTLSSIVGRWCRHLPTCSEYMDEALGRHGTAVEGVFHGTFGTGDLKPGELTVADCWKIIPYENMLATADVTARDLLTIVAEDASDKKSDRTLWPFEVVRDGEGRPQGVRHKGGDVDPERRLSIAFNSYDAQSGGRRLMKLREILQRPEAKLRTTPLDTRGALIEGLLNRGTIG